MENTVQSMPEDFRQADNFHVCRSMERGGGFMQALSTALQRADLENRQRIHDAWGESIQPLWEWYRRTGGW